MSFGVTGKNKAITFSYDDGVTQDICFIELLNKYGLKCTFNLNSDLLNQNGILIREGKRVSHYKVHKEDVKYIYDGHEIAAHTLTHPKLTECDDATVLKQVEQDRLHLSEIAGYDVVGLAYPHATNSYDDRVVNILKNSTGIKYSRTVKSTYNFEIQNDLLRFHPTVYHLEFDKMMDLGREFVELKTDTPKLFYIWGHSYELDYGTDYWAKMEEFFKLISNRDDIFYGTNKEVLL